jgi:acetyl-CoA carboxylase biotin carboxyl carrier protein
MALSAEDISEILEIIDAAGPGEVRIQTDGFSLQVAIGQHATLSNRAGAEAPLAPVAPVPAGAAGPRAEAGPAASAPTGAEAEAEPAEELQTIASPMLGTFYRSDSPGAPPFVEVGSLVEADTVVCIIEVMKMMNSVVAGVAGRVAEVCAEGGKLVEYDEPLFRVEPA